MLDTAEALDVLDRMEGEEKDTWEDLVQETEHAASWARRVREEEEPGPLLVTKQLLASQMIEESKWLQKRAATGKTKSRDLSDIAVLKEHQSCIEAMTERYGKILWRNGGSIPEPLRDLALAITKTNRQMVETIERARKKAHRNKRRRGDTPPPRRDSRGRTRSARSQVSHTPEEDQDQGREISYSPVTEDDVQERTITQDVPYINEESKRNKETKRSKDSRRNKDSRESRESERSEDMPRNEERQRSVEMDQDNETDRDITDGPTGTDEPKELEIQEDPEELMEAGVSDPRGGTKGPKRLYKSRATRARTNVEA